MRAFVIGALLWLPVAGAAWATTRPAPPAPPLHHQSAEVGAMPADDARLRAWLAAQPDLLDLRITRAPADAGRTWIEVRCTSEREDATPIPWEELGYAKIWSSSRGRVGGGQFNIKLGAHYYLGLLAATANLGFLIFGWRWFRRLDQRPRSRCSLPLQWLLGLGAGVLLAGLLTLWSRLPVVGGSLAGAWAAAALWPAWASVTCGIVLATLVPLAQELFFRGACWQPFAVAGNARRGAWTIAVAQGLAQVWPLGMVPGLALAVVTGGLRLYTGSLLAPLVASVVVHACTISWPMWWHGNPLDGLFAVVTQLGGVLGK